MACGGGSLLHMCHLHMCHSCATCTCAMVAYCTCATIAHVPLMFPPSSCVQFVSRSKNHKCRCILFNSINIHRYSFSYFNQTFPFLWSVMLAAPRLFLSLIWKFSNVRSFLSPTYQIPKKQRRSVYEWYVAPFQLPD